ncbi:MAG TPA: FAD-binding oxidoreductase [Ktedonobacterales bacterium]
MIERHATSANIGLSVAPRTDEIVEGWGMRNRTRSRVVRPRDVGEIPAIFAEIVASGGTIGLRGAGCSYGDASLNDGQTLLDCTALNRIRAWDAATGRITVEPGVTIAQLWQRMLPDGWWPMVVPGTSAVTLGGAAAANAHGKNNWRVGCIGDHILAFEIVVPSGETLICSREQNTDLFYGAIGGFGLLGCFTSITLQARRVHSGLVCETQMAYPSLDALLDGLESMTAEADDLVAWIDTSATGPRLGRGLLKASRDLAPGEDPAPRFSLSVAGQLPRSALVNHLPNGLLPLLARPLASRQGVWLANRAQWQLGQGQRATHQHLTSYARANFPLDAIPGWKDAYRPGGLIQHQSFVPRADAAKVFRSFIERSHCAGIAPSFAVLKKHRPDDFLLSYLGDGYSLALDYPVRRSDESKTLALMTELNDALADAGGRCYFAKDSTLTSEQVRRMYSEDHLARFLVLKSRYDRRDVLSTDFYRRVLAPR